MNLCGDEYDSLFRYIIIENHSLSIVSNYRNADHDILRSSKYIEMSHLWVIYYVFVVSVIFLKKKLLRGGNLSHI